MYVPAAIEHAHRRVRIFGGVRRGLLYFFDQHGNRIDAGFR
jgi:hypothetical protein